MRTLTPRHDITEAALATMRGHKVPLLVADGVCNIESSPLSMLVLLHYYLNHTGQVPGMSFNIKLHRQDIPGHIELWERLKRNLTQDGRPQGVWHLPIGGADNESSPINFVLHHDVDDCDSMVNGLREALNYARGGN